MNTNNDTNIHIPAAIQVTDPVTPESEAVMLTRDGHWGETQVIERIKEARLRNKCPQRILDGTATVPLDGDQAPGSIAYGPAVGRLVVSKPKLRTRLRRLFSN